MSMKSGGSVSYSLSDLFVGLGVLLLGAAVVLSQGWMGVLAYAGVVCLAVGLLLARKEVGR